MIKILNYRGILNRLIYIKYLLIDISLLKMQIKNENSCRTLHEICQYAKLIKNIKFNSIDNEYYECQIQLINNNHNIGKTDIYTDIGLGKKQSKQHAALKCIKSPEISVLIKKMLNDKKFKNKEYDNSNSNNYILWGKKIIDEEYKLHINNINNLKLLNKPIVAVDSEGFSKYGDYPSMIQIADDKTVLIFDYKKYHQIIKHFLQQKTIILYGAKNDLTQLKLNTNNYIDIQPMYKNKSLKKIASLLTNNNTIFTKPPGTFYSYKNWNFDNLDQNHIYYAAIDAVVTYKLYIHKNKFISKFTNLQNQKY